MLFIYHTREEPWFPPPTETGTEKRERVRQAKTRSRQGLFEALGSFDAGRCETELFREEGYRTLINALLYQSGPAPLWEETETDP
ncbi:MAG: hypothetical protein GWM98_02760 [Nitrospinaceae bacterium]|nr:hypothetical protein [Nitrospinaceae bacterium]NIR55920.1 hypothetical protein [Nitrospinaceae bacterium]NIS86367.1 hypothetical protein [Nitrospinaceae bacterium]NIT80829.1 hypothetical protein [Nitrospinaceae bacterium]NIU45414.1 hypothetical protein [Nitrospinaceae bacterium]